MDEHRILQLCMLAGRMLLRYGAETSRVEETIGKLAVSAGVPEDNVQSLVTPTGISISMTISGGATTHIGRVYETGRLDLAKVTMINDLSRRFARANCTLDEAYEELQRIDSAPPIYPLAVQAAAAAVSSGSFTVIFGGQSVDFFLGGAAGLLARLATDRLSRYVPRFFAVLLAGLLGTSMAVGASIIGLSDHQGAMVIGAIVPLLPGLAVTNSIRDLLAGDLLAGVARGAEAIFTSVAIAVAVAIAIGFSPHMGM